MYALLLNIPFPLLRVENKIQVKKLGVHKPKNSELQQSGNRASSFFLIFFFYLYSGGWSPNWVHSARRPLTGLLYLPRVIVRMENLVECMAGETEVLGENLPRRHFVHHKSHLTRPGLNPGRRGGKPAVRQSVTILDS
jgi:hypothetical protein